MKFTRLVPNIFYTDIKVGLRLFVECLEFNIGYDELKSDAPFCVVEKDELRIMLFQNKEYADKDRPEFRLVTNNIEDVYEKISSTHPELLHPNLKKVTLRPWGAKEFALKDESDVCIIIQQW
jgi:predicted HAD superfamily hydrolase